MFLFTLVPGFSQMCQTAVANLMQKNPGAEMFSKDSVGKFSIKCPVKLKICNVFPLSHF